VILILLHYVVLVFLNIKTLSTLLAGDQFLPAAQCSDERRRPSTRVCCSLIVIIIIIIINMLTPVKSNSLTHLRVLLTDHGILGPVN
jgi:hypothetical protein